MFVSSSSVPEYQPAESAPATVATQEAAISFWSRDKTFRPQRVVPESAGGGKAGRLLRTVDATMKATLNGGDLEQAVKCPPGEDLNEWLAINTINQINAASLIYGTVQSYCTHESCPVMAAGRAEYLWRDNTPQYKKPSRIPAPQYIGLMMSEIDAQITDPQIFPIEESQCSAVQRSAAQCSGQRRQTRCACRRVSCTNCCEWQTHNTHSLFVSFLLSLLSFPFCFSLASLRVALLFADAKFPRNFLSVLKQIYKRLFRLYAHIYCAHHEKIRAIGASAHLNTTFKHLAIFILEFDLVPANEMQPLAKLIQKFKMQQEEAQKHNQ